MRAPKSLKARESSDDLFLFKLAQETRISAKKLISEGDTDVPQTLELDEDKAELHIDLSSLNKKDWEKIKKMQDEKPSSIIEALGLTPLSFSFLEEDKSHPNKLVILCKRDDINCIVNVDASGPRNKAKVINRSLPLREEFGLRSSNPPAGAAA